MIITNLTKEEYKKSVDAENHYGLKVKELHSMDCYYVNGTKNIPCTCSVMYYLCDGENSGIPNLIDPLGSFDIAEIAEEDDLLIDLDIVIAESEGGDLLEILNVLTSKRSLLISMALREHGCSNEDDLKEDEELMRKKYGIQGYISIALTKYLEISQTKERAESIYPYVFKVLIKMKPGESFTKVFFEALVPNFG